MGLLREMEGEEGIWLVCGSQAIGQFIVLFVPSLGAELVDAWS
jgi:hypothetical protein